jgi:hypothetical protein
MARPRIHADDAARVRAFREKNDLVSMTVDLPRELVEGLEQYMRFKNLTKTAVLSKLIKSQLLRKR